MELPAAIAAESAITRQNVLLSGIKQNAERNEQFAKIIKDTVQAAPISGSRGSNVNILV